MRWLVVLLTACTTYWRGPGTRPVEEERIGPGARVQLELTWKMPADNPTVPHPAWLGEPGDAWSEQLAHHYGPAAFHNGHLPTTVRIPVEVDHEGFVDLALCPTIKLIGSTAKAVANHLERCAAPYVDEPRGYVRIISNPTWSVVVIDRGRRSRVPLQPGLTLVQLLALKHGADRAVSLQLVNQPARRIDVDAILEGKAADIALRFGDTVVID